MAEKQKSKAYPYPRIHNAVLLCLLLTILQAGMGALAGVTVGFFTSLGNPEGAAALAAGEMESEEVLLLQEEITRNTSAAGLVLTCLSMVIVIFAAYRKMRRHRAAMDLPQETFAGLFRLKSVSGGVWAATAVFTVGFILVSSEIDNLFNFILPMPEFLRTVFETANIKDMFWLSLLFMGISPAIVEELLFRGAFIGGFSQNYPAKKTIIVSAILFAVIHLNPWQALTAFGMGLASGWICLRFGSVLPGMFIHLVNNTLFTIVSEHEIPIQGFNAFTQPVEFQPLWLDAAGVVFFLAGIWLYKRELKKGRV